MKTKLICCVSLLAATVIATTALAATYKSRIVIGVDDDGELHKKYVPTYPPDPYDPYYPYDSTAPDFKPPAGMRTSDTWEIDVDYHLRKTFPIPGLDVGWAGARIKLHNLDPMEVDVDGIGPGVPRAGQDQVPLMIRALHTAGIPDPGVPPPDPPLPQYSGGLGPGPLTDPFGPRSNNVGTVKRVFTVVHTDAESSGIETSTMPLTSRVVPLLRLTLHAKNTNLNQNSEPDVSFIISDIWHLRGVTTPNGQPASSTYVTLPKSINLWSYSGINTAQYTHLEAGPPLNYPNGHWVHFDEDRLVHLSPGGGQSVFLANPLLRSVNFGIDHFVPEPTSVVLLGLGVVCAVMGVRSRRKRS